MLMWITILGMGAITYAIRLSLMAAMPRAGVGERTRLALGFVPPAVLSAIIFPELLRPEGVLALSVANVRLLAGLVAFVVAWRTENAVLTVTFGMITLWIASALR